MSRRVSRAFDRATTVAVIALCVLAGLAGFGMIVVNVFVVTPGLKGVWP